MVDNSERGKVDMGRVYGGQFQADERNNPRTIIARWVPQSARVLEVGPGDGVVGTWLTANKGCQVVGVEYVAAAAAAAAEHFAHMIVGSIEGPQVIEQVRALAPYDVIIFADVLEHLVDPWGVLRELRPLLSPGGRVLLSVPNIAHWTARLNLLLGRFDYTDGYLMDRTHLRWFTWKSARELAARSGYNVVEEQAVFKPRFARFWRTFNGFQIVLNLAPDTAHVGVRDAHVGVRDAHVGVRTKREEEHGAARDVGGERGGEHGAARDVGEERDEVENGNAGDVNAKQAAAHDARDVDMEREAGK